MDQLFTDCPCPIPGDELAYGLFQQACRDLDAVPEAERAAAGSRMVLALLLRLLDALPAYDALRMAGATMLAARQTLEGHGQLMNAPTNQARH